MSSESEAINLKLFLARHYREIDEANKDLVFRQSNPYRLGNIYYVWEREGLSAQIVEPIVPAPPGLEPGQLMVSNAQKSAILVLRTEITGTIIKSKLSHEDRVFLVRFMNQRAWRS
jgi:hypothetical protein